jgi:hypothetical protein
VAQPKELGRVCDEIADRIHAQYTIAYYPPRDGTAGWHSVRIAPRKAGLRVVASKTGYFR